VLHKKEGRFFEGEVMWSKLYQSHKILSSLQLQKNDASPRADFGRRTKLSGGALSIKQMRFAPYACGLRLVLSGASSASTRSTMSGYFT